MKLCIFHKWFYLSRPNKDGGEVKCDKCGKESFKNLDPFKDDYWRNYIWCPHCDNDLIRDSFVERVPNTNEDIVKYKCSKCDEIIYADFASGIDVHFIEPSEIEKHIREYYIKNQNQIIIRGGEFKNRVNVFYSSENEEPYVILGFRKDNAVFEEIELIEGEDKVQELLDKQNILIEFPNLASVDNVLEFLLKAREQFTGEDTEVILTNIKNGNFNHKIINKKEKA